MSTYSLTYRLSRKGGSGSLTSKNPEDIIRKMKSLFKLKLPATAYLNKRIIGRVFEDTSCRTGWNWYFDEDSVAPSVGDKMKVKLCDRICEMTFSGYAKSGRMLFSYEGFTYIVNPSNVQ